jgi:hypothetical protein
MLGSNAPGVNARLRTRRRLHAECERPRDRPDNTHDSQETRRDLGFHPRIDADRRPGGPHEGRRTGDAFHPDTATDAAGRAGLQRPAGSGDRRLRPREDPDRHRRHHRQARPAEADDRRTDSGRLAVCGVRRDHAGCADPADRARHRLLPPARLRRHRRLRWRLVHGRIQGHRRGHRHRQAAARPGWVSEVRPAQSGTHLRRAHHRRHRLRGDGGRGHRRPRDTVQAGDHRPAAGAEYGSGPRSIPTAWRCRPWA